jgi:hypothetical protein
MKERCRAPNAKQFNRDCFNVPVERRAKAVRFALPFGVASFGLESGRQGVLEFVIDMTCVCG